MNKPKKIEIEHALMGILSPLFLRGKSETSAREITDLILENWTKLEEVELRYFDELNFFLKQLDYIDEYVEGIGGGESYWIARDGTEYRADVGYGLEFWWQLSGQLRKEATKVVSRPPDTQIREEIEVLRKVRAENESLKIAVERQKNTIDGLRTQLKVAISPMPAPAEDEEDL